MGVVKYNTEQLKTMAAQGLTYEEITAELGQENSETVRLAMQRRQIYARDVRTANPRAAIQMMKPKDAIEYLLHQIDLLMHIDPHSQIHIVDKWKLKVPLSISERKILIALINASPRTLSREQLISALMFGRYDDPPNSNNIPVYICKIRAKLGKTFGMINNSHSQGYSWEFHKE